MDRPLQPLCSHSPCSLGVTYLHTFHWCRCRCTLVLHDTGHSTLCVHAIPVLWVLLTFTPSTGVVVGVPWFTWTGHCTRLCSHNPCSLGVTYLHTFHWCRCRCTLVYMNRALYPFVFTQSLFSRCNLPSHLPLVSL